MCVQSFVALRGVLRKPSRELIPTATTRTTRVAFWDPPSGSRNCHTVLCVQLTDRSDVVAVSVVNLYVDSCIWSIEQSDSITVEQAIQTFDVSVYIISIYSLQITTLLDNVLVSASTSDSLLYLCFVSNVSGVVVSGVIVVVILLVVVVVVVVVVAVVVVIVVVVVEIEVVVVAVVVVAVVAAAAAAGAAAAV